MAVTIIIAGTDRTADVKLDGFSIQQVLTYQEDNCSFEVTSGDKPTTGQEIIVTDGATKLFAGIIDQVNAEELPGGIRRFKCQARDYTYLMDRRLVVENYEGWTADAIVRDILARYCPTFTVTNVASGAPVIESTGSDFNYIRPSECMKWLCDYCGWDWYVDYDKDVHFSNSTTLSEAAPLTVDINSAVRNFKFDLDTSGLRNRVYVRGGTMLSDFVTYEYKADGVQTAWVLPYKPHEITISVGGAAPVTPGIENINEESGETWMMNFQEKIVRQATGQAVIPDGTTVAFTFKYDLDVITYRENVASQAAIAAIQGGDGVYEHSIVDDSLNTLDAAGAMAEADLREFDNPRAKGTLDTSTFGCKPGQILPVDLPLKGIDNDYVIQKVTITPRGTGWNYKIEFGGRLLGIADYLKAIISKQQKTKQQTEILHKIQVFNEDAIAITDSITATPRTPPYVCGDADAICGFVMCAEEAATPRPEGYYFISPGFAANIE